MRIRLAGNALQAFAKAAAGCRDVLWKALLLSGHDVQRQAKINVKQVLNTTGESKGILGRSIKPWPEKSRLEVRVGTEIIYGAVHEFGAVINPVKGEFLWFEGKGGGLVHVRSVRIPARPYLGPALEKSQPKIKARIKAVVTGQFPGGMTGG